MKKSDFYYALPEELIAQTPVEPRNSSRLMAIDRKSGDISHRHFYDLADYLKKGDCLILNDTRVLPARIFGVKNDTGAVVEFVLLAQKENMVWECLAGPGRRAKPGACFSFGEGILRGEVLDVIDGGNRLVKFECDGVFFDVLDRVGQMPLPPYIHEKLNDKERYQTVYSKELGSAAAPTAGLHFTPQMLNELKANGINIGYVTLHVGLGTFRPVKEDDVTKHKMHTEHYFMPSETARLINETKKDGGRVICVGTTGCRTVESVFSFLARDNDPDVAYIEKDGKGSMLLPENRDFSGDTDIFIYPGYEFKCMDGLITNFHLPESTLIMLVSAFLGYDKTMNAYKTAVDERYRFFSFGDAMIII